MEKLFKRIDTVFLKVKNFDESIDWYKNILGLHLRWRIEQGYAAFDIGETALTLVREVENAEFKPKEEAIFNFYVTDIQETHRYLESQHVELGPIEDGGDVVWFWFKDIDGNRLEAVYFEE